MASNQTLHNSLKSAARQFPDAIAVEDPVRDVAIGYLELTEVATALGRELLTLGVSPGDRVAVYAPKSIPTVVGIFAALEAGAAYVPLDSGAPAKRNAFIVEDCAARAMFVERSLLDGLMAELPPDSVVLRRECDELSMFGTDLVLVESRFSPPIAPLAADISRSGLAYILYTSGSTGVPKGVMHTHASALSFIDWCSDEFAVTPSDRFSSHAPFHFDLSILDLHVSLKHGATVVLIGDELGKQPMRLAPEIADRGITVWYSTPSILRLLVEYGKLERYDYSDLRIVLFAGEVFPLKYLTALMLEWPNPRYFNLYGPTETNVCTSYAVPRSISANRTEPFPIGTACSGNMTRVVDREDREVSHGEEGELQVSGGSVMLGYWSLPDKDLEAFCSDEAGTRWYRTGDVVRADEDGNLLYLGRRDRMVKRYGYRVELGEIEAALNRHASVRLAAAVASDEDGDVVIKAVLSCTEERAPTIIELKQYCAEQLPAYMIPDRFIIVPSIPKTSTDKIDYPRLEDLD